MLHYFKAFHYYIYNSYIYNLIIVLKLSNISIFHFVISSTEKILCEFSIFS